LLRAALEGVAFALRDARDALVAEGTDVGDLHLVGGGGGDPRWRALLATVLGRRLTVHRWADVSVVGAARLAASSVGMALPPAADDDPTTVEPDISHPVDDAWTRWRARRPRRGQLTAEANASE
jgi:xylulokinase